MNHDKQLAQAFTSWIEPFCQAFRHKAQRQWAPLYVRGLLAPGDRKSVEPMASRVAPEDLQQLHHFVSTSKWDTAPLEAVLLEKADRLVGGDDAHLIIDDTGIPKKGEHSVGVAHQYCGAVGKQANSQSLVSVTLARDDVPVPIALRLYLPQSWAVDAKRRALVGVPDSIVFRTKPQIAIEEVRRIRDAGVRFGDVLADAGYGASYEFRHALTEMDLRWAVGVMPDQLVYPSNTKVRPPPKRKPGAQGATKKWGTPNAERQKAADLFEDLKVFRVVSWRRGTKGKLSAKFAAVRVRPADGDDIGHRVRLPTAEAWLVCELRGDERRFYLSNYPADTSLKTLAGIIKARWSCEQAHQQLKEELGLDHFEGRSWHGLHHHALLTLIAFGFLQHMRARQNKA